MKRFCIILSLACSFNVYAQQPPGAEIYLMDLSVRKSKIRVTKPENITNHPGYDNQPSFSPDKSLLYYTSANAEGKTDLVEYNFKSKKSRKITNTPEREYSPTVTPNRKFISCVIQRDNGAQDLGQYPIGGGDAVVLINSLIVGYHAWINEQSLLLFVLGDTMTLQRYDLVSRKNEIIAKSIGRSLHKIPETDAMSFVHKISDSQWVIKRLNMGGSIDPIVSTLPGREDLTWTRDGKILMSDGKKLFYFEPGKTSEWVEIAMPAMPSGSVTRLTVNQKGNKLAIVLSE